MPGPIRDRGAKKRKQPPNRRDAASVAKKPRAVAPQPPRQCLKGPHESILADLAPKYNVLAASVISSTKIQKRVAGATTHLLGDEKGQPRVALLYARTAEVCKLITMVEQCKRVLGEEGRQWFQYNQLFDLPEEPRKRDVVEETILEDAEETSDEDDFEVMHSRFEDALLPPPTTPNIKSLRVFLSLAPIPELKTQKDVTVQSGREKKS